MTDVLGRSWQMGTIQLDSQMPARFGLTYMGADNEEHTPYVIHRALFGSLERFIGILIEHYAGAFPFWLAPVQIRILPVGEGHRGGRPRAGARSSAEFRVEVDERDETVGKRIRDAEVEKIPVTIVYGDKESDDSLAVRERGGEQSTRTLDELLLTPCYPVTLHKQGPSPHLPGTALRGGSTESTGRGFRAAACSGFCRREGGNESLVTRL